MVRLLLQLLAERLKESLDALGLDPLERNPVHSRRTVVCFREPVRLPEHIELPHVRVETPKAVLGFCLRLLTYPLPKFLHTNRGLFHTLYASLRPRYIGQPGPFARLRGPLASLPPVLTARSHRVTGGSSLLRAQRPPSGLRSLLPAPTFLRGLLPRDQEGFASSGATHAVVPPLLPRRN